jgi:hypothetical protein
MQAFNVEPVRTLFFGIDRSIHSLPLAVLHFQVESTGYLANGAADITLFRLDSGGSPL